MIPAGRRVEQERSNCTNCIIAAPPGPGHIPAVMKRPGWSWLLVAALGPAPLGAQGASPYIPLHHWAMPYVEYLISTGVIVDPTPLTRPLREAELVRALQAADTVRLGAAARATVRRLAEE